MEPASQQIHCPQCGAPAQFRGTTVSLVCEFCDSTIVRTGVDVKLIGKVSALLDTGSPVLLNSSGNYRGLPFTLVGRLQLRYARGTWNEWFVAFADGTVGWLADASGQYSIVRPKSVEVVAGRVPRFHEVETGQELAVDGVRAVVVDKRGASYQGAEGSLPFEAEPGLTFYAVDLRGYGGEFFTLDWGTDPNHVRPEPYIGTAVDLVDLGLHPLRRFEGWEAPRR